MKMLSYGLPSTLGSYLKICRMMFGDNSVQVKYIQSRIDTAQNGENEEVLADEDTFLFRILKNIK